MNSSISPFRPWLLALAGVCLIEFTFWSIAHPPRITWNSFFDLKYAHTETFQRLVAYEKIIAFKDADPDIIQVGDSSGLHGIQPPIVMSYIPGWQYLNLGVATNLGYSGYYDMAKLQLERSPNARYLILYTSALGGVPRKLLWDGDLKLMAPLIYNEFLSPMHRLFQLPTLAARNEVTEYTYYLGQRFRKRGAPLSLNRGYLAFEAVFRESDGWTRETDVEGDVPANIYKAFMPGVELHKSPAPAVLRAALRQFPKVTDERFFDWRSLSKVSYFDYVYGAFADLARQHGAKLVVIFNPMPESSRRPEFDEMMDWPAIEAALERFRGKHPEVYVGRFEFWPDDKFSVFSHIATQHSDESSQRVGRILKGIIGSERPAPRAHVAERAMPPAGMEIDFHRYYCGYGWTDKAGTTNAFPLQYVGPRNRAWLFFALAPGRSYVLRATFRAGDAQLAHELELRVNRLPVRWLDGGRSGQDQYADFQLPEEVLNMYHGWLTLEFRIPGAGAASVERAVAFERVVAKPLAGQ